MPCVCYVVGDWAWIMQEQQDNYMFLVELEEVVLDKLRHGSLCYRSLLLVVVSSYVLYIEYSLCVCLKSECLSIGPSVCLIVILTC